MEEIWSTLQRALGTGAEPKDLTFFNVTLRGVVVFILTIFMVRLGDKRFLSKKTAFDAVLGFILASMMARAINGSAAFFPTLGAGFIIVLLHRLMAHGSMRWHKLGVLVKGTDQKIIENGVVDRRALRMNNFSDHDLHEDLRINGQTNDPAEVQEARLERNGDISVVRRAQA